MVFEISIIKNIHNITKKIKPILIPSDIENSYIFQKVKSIIKSFKIIKYDTKTKVINKINKSKYPLVYHRFKDIPYSVFKDNYHKNPKPYQNLFNLSDVKPHSYPLSEIIHNNNTFISLPIQYFCESNDLFHHFITYYDGDILNTINIYTKSKNIKPNMIKEIQRNIFVMKNLSNNKTPVFLHIIECDEKKTIPKDDEYITMDNINSGCCYPSKYIYIWRIEDLTKVLIHELIHFYKLDIKPIPNEKLENIFDNIDYSLFIDYTPELFTESLALIINSIIVSEKYDILNIKNVLYYEMNFSYIQFIKILSRKKIKQTTSVRSYFLLKFLLLFQLDKFINYLNKFMKTKKHDNDEIYNLLITSYSKIKDKIASDKILLKDNLSFTNTGRLTIF